MKNLYRYEKVAPYAFLAYYGLYSDPESLNKLRVRLLTLEKIHERQENSSRQAWVNSFARIMHESDRNSKGNVIYTTNPKELAYYINDLMRRTP
jgi:hypothetical protein